LFPGGGRGAGEKQGIRGPGTDVKKEVPNIIFKKDAVLLKGRIFQDE
jgi:hypothetical protein